MRLPIETANLRRRRANFDAHEIGQPVPGPIETLDSDEPWMGDHFTQENFEQLQDAQIDGELGPALDLTRQAMLKKWKFARFAEGDTAGFEKWLKTQPKAVQEDWAANKEKYGDQFKTAKQITPLAEAKKGDFVEVTYKGEKVTGKVYRVKVDGTITVDVEKTRDNPGGHSDEDVSLVDIRVSKKARFAEGDTAGFEKWLKTQPKAVQEDWESNKEKYGDQFLKKAHRRNASGIDSNPYLSPKVKSAVKGFEDALDGLMQKKGILCRVASSSLDELEAMLIEEKRKSVMMGDDPDDFKESPHGFQMYLVREYLEEITAACESLSSLQRLISFMDSRDRY
jgi:hypothetical protein